jgi:hypothetical protein
MHRVYIGIVARQSDYEVHRDGVTGMSEAEASILTEIGWECAREIGVPILAKIGIVKARKIGAGHEDGFQMIGTTIVTEIRVATPEYRRDDNNEGSGGRQIELAWPEDSGGNRDDHGGAGAKQSGHTIW